MYRVGNLTAMAIIAGSFLWLMNTLITQNRADRIEDRELFRQTMHTLSTEQQQRTIQIQGALDATTGSMRELTGEIKSWRRDKDKGPKP